MNDHIERQDQLGGKYLDERHNEDLTNGVTLHEERLKVGTELIESGRVKLRRYVVTQDQTITVPVSREVLEIRRERIAPADLKGVRGELDATTVDDSVEEIVLREERILVSKEVVEVERVQVVKDKVTQEQVVTEQVRREHVEIDNGDGTFRALHTD